MKKTNTKKVALGVGLGLAAAAAAGAGYYFYGSKDAKTHRKKVAKWAGDMKEDVVKRAKKLQKLDEKAYKAIVDESVKAYERVKSIDKADLAAAAAELKSNWKTVERELARVGKKEARVIKKVGKETAKKTVKSVKKAAKQLGVKSSVKKAVKVSKTAVKKKKA